MFLHQRCQCIQFSPAVDRPRGVARIAQKHRLGALGDLGFEVFDGWQGKSIVNVRGDRHNVDARHLGKAIVIGIERFWNDDFVSRVEAGHEREHQSLGTSGGHEDFLRRNVHMHTAIVSRQPFSVTRKPFARTVFDHRSGVASDSLQGNLWRRNVGLSNVEMNDALASLFCLGGKRSQFPNGAVGHGLSLEADAWHVSDLRLRRQRYVQGHGAMWTDVGNVVHVVEKDKAHSLVKAKGHLPCVAPHHGPALP